MKKAVAKTTEKYVTIPVFEKAMVSIAKSFNSIGETLESIKKDTKTNDLILTEIKRFNEETKAIRSNVSVIDTEMISQDREIKSLNVRVGKLEVKVK